MVGYNFFWKELFKINASNITRTIDEELCLIKKNYGLCLKDKNGDCLSEEKLLESIREYCEKLASKDNENDTRKTVSQMVISLFNLIKESMAIGRFEKDDLWYVEELVDEDFERLYPECFDHINGKTFWDTFKEAFSKKNIVEGIKDDMVLIVKNFKDALVPQESIKTILNKKKVGTN